MDRCKLYRGSLYIFLITYFLVACVMNAELSHQSADAVEPLVTATIKILQTSTKDITSDAILEESATPRPTEKHGDMISQPTSTLTSTPDLRISPENWQNWPIIPTVSESAREIYLLGQTQGNKIEKFSKVGDCQSITTYFLVIFDDPKQYRLGPDHESLQEAIDNFSGCFSRKSVATKGGMNVASVLSHFWADKEQCKTLESPLECELRLNKPSIVLISMEESWGRNNKVENYENYMRQIIEIVIDTGAVPILATKADNKEGGHLINQAIARLAYEYDIPLWNFWLAVQPLPNQGLLEDGFHLTHGLNYFDDANNLKRAWPMRNLTALQVIDAVWRQLNQMPYPIDGGSH